MNLSKGMAFREALQQESTLLLPGVINAYIAKLAEKTGFRSIYLSGAGISNANFGLPDLGLTSLRDVTTEISRITSATNLPLVVDGDTGWGGVLNIAYTVREFIKAGAAAVHFEDQDWPKRCGHREGKKLVSTSEMVDKLKSAIAAKKELDPDFFIIARTDAIAVEGMKAALKRAESYLEAGAEALFVEAVTSIEQYKEFVEAFPDIPILANITEFGKTPMFTREDLSSAGVKIMLFPLSAFRAMNKAALNVLQEIKNNGTQKSILNEMETRESLYENLDYFSYENKL